MLKIERIQRKFEWFRLNRYFNKKINKRFARKNRKKKLSLIKKKNKSLKSKVRQGLKLLSLHGLTKVFKKRKLSEDGLKSLRYFNEEVSEDDLINPFLKKYSNQKNFNFYITNALKNNLIFRSKTHFLKKNYYSPQLLSLDKNNTYNLKLKHFLFNKKKLLRKKRRFKTSRKIYFYKKLKAKNKTRITRFRTTSFRITRLRFLRRVFSKRKLKKTKNQNKLSRYLKKSKIKKVKKKKKLSRYLRKENLKRIGNKIYPARTRLRIKKKKTFK